ncbi:Rho guanine nucleotide exchange factor 6 [Ameca splendens]|uniref:Rho guanine nucleotide exchange factor 6 n=3 Tax=Goodeidae TaxID=28758 RepID=A0ABV0XFS9_9TELE
MNPEEQTVTWLISLGVLSSPKKNIADPEEFLKTSLKDGVVLCKLTERLIPGFTPKYSQDPRTEADCISNIREFLRGCSSLKVEVSSLSESSFYDPFLSLSLYSGLVVCCSPQEKL